MFEIPKVAGTIKLPDQLGTSVVVNEALVREIGITDAEKQLVKRLRIGIRKPPSLVW